MSDKPALPQSQEAVALELLHLVAAAEGKNLRMLEAADRKWILDAYAECLDVVQRPVRRLDNR